MLTLNFVVYVDSQMLTCRGIVLPLGTACSTSGCLGGELLLLHFPGQLFRWEPCQHCWRCHLLKQRQQYAALL